MNEIICGEYICRVSAAWVRVSLKDDGMYLFEWSEIGPSYKTFSEAEKSIRILTRNDYQLSEASVAAHLLKTYEV
jgi:hypothetical protein